MWLLLGRGAIPLHLLDCPEVSAACSSGKAHPLPLLRARRDGGDNAELVDREAMGRAFPV